MAGSKSGMMGMSGKYPKGQGKPMMKSAPKGMPKSMPKGQGVMSTGKKGGKK